MKRLTYLVISISAIAVVFAATVYVAWIPSPKEPPYELVAKWGAKGVDPGQFNEPTGIAVTDDKVFVSDSRNRRIQVFDHNGQFIRQFGNPRNKQSGEESAILERPMNLSIANQQLYVADYFSDTIKIYTLGGEFVRAVGQGGDGPAQFNAPGGVAVSGNGNIYVADFVNQRIQQLDNNGQFIRQWGNTKTVGVWSGEFNYPTDVAVNNKGYLYVADGYNDRIQVFSPQGNYVHKWGGPFGMNIFGSFNGWFATVTGIAIDPQGHVFVADFYNDRIQKFTEDGEFLTAFGIPGNSPTHTAIAVDVSSNGSVFVADYANHQIQKWRPGE